MISPAREAYRVDLSALQAACEANYWRLMRLLPSMRNPAALRRVAFSQGEQAQGALVVEVQENSPYTTTLSLRQEQPLPWLPVPQMEVRVYHDARMAEVTVAQAQRHFRGLYPYPNPQMHQPDEKTQLNLFLGEWLGHCLTCGHEPLPLTSSPS